MLIFSSINFKYIMKVTVFEVINEKRREIFVAATDKPIFMLAQQLREAPPKAIAGWKATDVTSLRSIEFGLSESDARSFIATHVKSALPPGWSFVLGGA